MSAKSSITIIGLFFIIFGVIVVDFSATQSADVYVDTIFESDLISPAPGVCPYMAAGDLTNDGNIDLVFTKAWKARAAVYQRLNGEWDSGTILEGPIPTLWSAERPIIAPIRNDGLNWLVYSEHDGGNQNEWLRAHRYSGTVLVESKDVSTRLGHPGWFAPGFGDLDADGYSEIWVVTIYGTGHHLRRHVWDPVTNSYPGVEIKTSGGDFDLLIRPVTDDFIGDGTESLIWLSWSNSIDLVTYTPGSGTFDHTSETIVTLPDRIRTFAAGDYDSAPGADIAVTTWDGSNSSIYLVSGNTFNVTEVVSGIVEQITVVSMADLDGDGFSEIYAAGIGGGIYGYDDASGWRQIDKHIGYPWCDGVSTRLTGESHNEVLLVARLSTGYVYRVVSLTAEQVNNPPSADANGPYLVETDSAIVLNGTGFDPDQDTLNYSWSATTGGFVDDTLEDPTYLAPSEAGIYELMLSVTDRGGLSDQDTTIVVVYDPDGGFVTGGGWIDSPMSAYKPDPSLTGKATFGFVSKYKKGTSVPTGNTEFQFQTTNLNFHSIEYDWLIVNQDGTNAQFKGNGTINSSGEYKFMLWAGDGEPDDTFRIKIWEEDEVGNETVIYDNDFDQAIGGGSIVVHTK